MIRAVYPLAKRFTNYPQFVLACSFNSGILVSLAAVLGNNSLFFEPHQMLFFLPLYFSGIFWTVIYDTIYGHQDKKDDLKIGVKSTALKWQDNTKPISQNMNRAMFGLLGIHGLIFSMNWSYFVMLGIMYRFHWRLIRNVDLDNPESCKQYFLKMKMFGFLLGLAFVLGKMEVLNILKKTNEKD